MDELQQQLEALEAQLARHADKTKALQAQGLPELAEREHARYKAVSEEYARVGSQLAGQAPPIQAIGEPPPDWSEEAWREYVAHYGLEEARRHVARFDFSTEAIGETPLGYTPREWRDYVTCYGLEEARNQIGLELAKRQLAYSYVGRVHRVKTAPDLTIEQHVQIILRFRDALRNALHERLNQDV